jgi:hypothetical protein
LDQESTELVAVEAQSLQLRVGPRPPYVQSQVVIGEPLLLSISAKTGQGGQLPSFGRSASARSLPSSYRTAQCPPNGGQGALHGTKVANSLRSGAKLARVQPQIPTKNKPGHGHTFVLSARLGDNKDVGPSAGGHSLLPLGKCPQVAALREHATAQRRQFLASGEPGRTGLLWKYPTSSKSPATVGSRARRSYR